MLLDQTGANEVGRTIQREVSLALEMYQGHCDFAAVPWEYAAPILKRGGCINSGGCSDTLVEAIAPLLGSSRYFLST